MEAAVALEIIGPGFGRTGTNSLKIAFEQLGFGPCHHMHEVSGRPELLPVWEAVARGEQADWDAVFAGYRAQVDWPGARAWRELGRHWPDARVILTVRDPDEWFDSVQLTIAPYLAGRGQHPEPHDNAVATMCQSLIGEQVFDGRLSDRAHATRVFRRHADMVQSEMAPERLLVFDVRQGWGPLCAFLGVPVPDTRFPKTNSTREFRDAVWRPE